MVDDVTFVRTVKSNQLNLNRKILRKLTCCDFIQGPRGGS